MKYNIKKQLLIGLLILMAGAAGLAAYSRSEKQEKKQEEKRAETALLTPPSKTADSIAAVQDPPADRKEEARKEADKKETAAVLRYVSAQKEGTIGRYAGKQIDHPADHIFSVFLDRQPGRQDRVWLCYELTGVTDASGIPVSINDRLARGGYLVKRSDQSRGQREQIHPLWLQAGENQIAFSLPAGADYGYRIHNLSIEIEKNAVPAPSLVVQTSPVSFKGQAYIRGFIQGGEGKAYISGNEIPSVEGEFETLIDLPASRKIEITAALANGQKLSRELAYEQDTPADAVFVLDPTVRQAAKTFRQGVSDRMELETARLEIDSAALLAPSQNITLTALRAVDLPALDMGLTNVTAEREGYRFLPHGEHFAEGATVSLSYDRTKLPSGFTEDDIKTFYFDRETRRWAALERVSLNKENQSVVSKTTHFTDMINGVIQTPESPETQGFAPTVMNGVQAANPAAKVQLIAPPGANPFGSAGLSYSLEMPPARNGMQPVLGLQYNSDGSGGWLGEGWDLGVPSIAVDTRWGVPRYNEDKETETYLMNGSMLAAMDENGESSVAHRGEKIDRQADRQFYPRNEGSFSKIIRKGNSPSNYTWEVADAAGTVYTYGAGGVLKGTVQYLDEGPKEAIAEWKLTRVEELHGDWIEYLYETADEPVRGNLTAKAIYLKEVRAGNKGSGAHTVVSLLNRSTDKSKQTNQARYGFLTSNNRLLEKAVIAFEGKTLRSYGFRYAEGAFNAEVLDQITHYDSGGNVFASHTMDYYDDVDSKNGYQPFQTKTETWNLQDDGIDGGFINPVSSINKRGFNDKPTALGGSKTTAKGYSVYVGAGANDWNLISKSNTGGVSYSRSSTTTTGLSTLADINGDGLPDKVYVKNGKLYYRPCAASASGETRFGDETAIQGINEFSRTKGKSNGVGAKAYVGFGNAVAQAGNDSSWGDSETSVYFSDVNSDGLIDVVKNGNVYFNHIETDASGRLIPTFTLSSGDTPSPIRGGGFLDISDTEITPEAQAEAIQNSPLQDAVRVWEAPFTGNIRIEGTVQLQAPEDGYDEDDYAKADGARAAIQVGNAEQWSKTIGKGDFTVYPATVGSAVVNRGQKIYFRLQSGNTETANGSFDQVKWSPIVTYTDRVNQIDPNGLGTAVYALSDADFVSVEMPNYVPAEASVNVSGHLVKPALSDQVSLQAILSNSSTLDDGTPNPDYREIVVYQRSFSAEETFDGDLSFDVPNTIGGENLRLAVSSETNVAFSRIKWTPQIHYTIDGNTASMPATVYYSVFANQLAEGQTFQLEANGTLRIEPALNFPPSSAANGQLVMAVKSSAGLIAKQQVIVTNGAVDPSSTLASANAPAGGVWIEYYGTDANLVGLISNPSARVTINGITISLAASLYAPREDEGYGNLYRGWGQFVYNAGEGRCAAAIDPSLLKLPEDESEADPMKLVFQPMGLDVQTKSYWTGPNPDVWIQGGGMSASRLGDPDVILVNPLAGRGTAGFVSDNCLGGSTADAPPLTSKNFSNATLAGVSGLGPVSPSASIASGSEEVTRAFLDMNGDSYPDYITFGKIQYTNTNGGRDGEILSAGSLQTSTNNSKTIGLGAAPVHANSNTTAGTASGNALNRAKTAVANAQKGLSASLDVPLNYDESDCMLIDLNGDGLPDKILSDKRVQLNLGYGFSEAADWGLDDTQKGVSISATAGIGGGLEWAASSISAGFGVTATFSQSSYTLMDVNGDGLPDRVYLDHPLVDQIFNGQTQTYVAFNTGNGFASPLPWQGLSAIGESVSTAESANAAATYCIPIVIAGLKFAVTASGNLGRSMNSPLEDLRDVDGDGFPDRVSSEQEGILTVARSAIARTNKLRTVRNPLGGRFTLDYSRSEATYDHPSGKWVLASVEVNDEMADDGPNQKTAFEYRNGRRERHERQFLGFGKVIAKSLDTGKNDALYRQAVQEYDVSSIYSAGNLLRSAIEDAEGRKFSESVQDYYSYRVTAAGDDYRFATDASICSDRAAAFTPRKYVQTLQYEGEADGLTANESYYEYYLNGFHGELKAYKYSDQGPLGANGTGNYNYQTSLEYAGNPSKHIFGLPVKAEVRGSDGELYRKTEAVYDLNYSDHLTQAVQTLDGQGHQAVVDIVYDAAGNILRKTLPANSRGQRMFFQYLYDRDYNQYPIRVEDAFGYRTEWEEYDYRYGLPLTTRDRNGYTLETTIDALGRIVSLTAPNEQVIGAPYTLQFEYHPAAVLRNDGTIDAPAYAVAKHYDPQHPADNIETVAFADGFGRTVQVKKDGVLYENGTDKTVMIVSGRILFDAFGRAIHSYYPVAENAGNKTMFNRTFDAVSPTQTQYDVLDRVVKTILPDGSETAVAYTKDDSSLIATATDAMGGRQAAFTNGSGLTVKTEQYSGPEGTITTRFVFDPIRQLLKAIDNGGNETVSTYDLAGRRTQTVHPVSGETNLTYDNSGNLLSRQTANLKEENRSIEYVYDYNRLAEIHYPDHPENNVKYSYGNKNASYNRVGRLMLQEDATGAQEFFYDRLGNVDKIRRTVVIPNQAIATYVTEWRYDSWNRLTEMIYPDLEKITYSYNTGGLLENVKGQKSYSYNYVNKLGYDQFEQRIYLKYCNGAETNYSYDNERRRLSALTVKAGGGMLMNNAYRYDAVDNVLGVTNSAPIQSAGMGRQMSHSYNYDGLYRLISATGTYTGAENKSAAYTLDMAYDNLHNITSKKQHLQQQGIQFEDPLAAGYDLTYHYANNPFQISTLDDENYRTEGGAEKDKITNERAYQYDANGNLIYVNTAREKQDGTVDKGGGEKKYLWDEENRLLSVNINGFISSYWYDADGERVIKASGDDEGLFVNSVFSGARTSTDNFTAYINPYLVVSKGGNYTKHIYIGSQRIVSKLGDLDSYGQDPRRIAYAGSDVDGASVDFTGKYAQSQQTIKDRYADFEVPYNGTDNDDYVNGGGFCCDDNPKLRAGAIGNGNDNPEIYQYYYHSDHLGSTSLITDLDGDIVQHVEYVPFGE
ncbi:MAG: type IV secretion protein Rhs, partial [Candidatus Azobacteroides sp.]|nr:type IV secretion protein Rhs [Candidatus Azobacteroides sp.]